jgi:hypothetical protein
MMETKVSVTGLYNYISQMDEERYKKWPIIEGRKTKQEALNFLTKLEAQGVNWI